MENTCGFALTTHPSRRVVHDVSMKLITSMDGEAEPLNGAKVAKTVALVG